MIKSILNKDSVEEIINKAKPDYLENLNNLKIQIKKEDADPLEKEK